MDIFNRGRIANGERDAVDVNAVKEVLAGGEIARTKQVEKELENRIPPFCTSGNRGRPNDGRSS